MSTKEVLASEASILNKTLNIEENVEEKPKVDSVKHHLTGTIGDEKALSNTQNLEGLPEPLVVTELEEIGDGSMCEAKSTTIIFQENVENKSLEISDENSSCNLLKKDELHVPTIQITLASPVKEKDDPFCKENSKVVPAEQQGDSTPNPLETQIGASENSNSPDLDPPFKTPELEFIPYEKSPDQEEQKSPQLEEADSHRKSGEILSDQEVLIPEDFPLNDPPKGFCESLREKTLSKLKDSQPYSPFRLALAAAFEDLKINSSMDETFLSCDNDPEPPIIEENVPMDISLIHLPQNCAEENEVIKEEKEESYKKIGENSSTPSSEVDVLEDGNLFNKPPLVEDNLPMDIPLIPNLPENRDKIVDVIGEENKVIVEEKDESYKKIEENSSAPSSEVDVLEDGNLSNKPPMVEDNLPMDVPLSPNLPENCDKTIDVISEENKVIVEEKEESYRKIEENSSAPSSEVEVLENGSLSNKSKENVPMDISSNELSPALPENSDKTIDVIGEENKVIVEEKEESYRKIEENSSASSSEVEVLENGNLSNKSRENVPMDISSNELSPALPENSDKTIDVIGEENKIVVEEKDESCKKIEENSSAPSSEVEVLEDGNLSNKPPIVEDNLPVDIPLNGLSPNLPENCDKTVDVIGEENKVIVEEKDESYKKIEEISSAPSTEVEVLEDGNLSNKPPIVEDNLPVDIPLNGLSPNLSENCVKTTDVISEENKVTVEGTEESYKKIEENSSAPSSEAEVSVDGNLSHKSLHDPVETESKIKNCEETVGDGNFVLFKKRTSKSRRSSGVTLTINEMNLRTPTPVKENINRLDNLCSEFLEASPGQGIIDYENYINLKLSRNKLQQNMAKLALEIQQIEGIILEKFPDKVKVPLRKRKLTEFIKLSDQMKEPVDETEEEKTDEIKKIAELEKQCAALQEKNTSLENELKAEKERSEQLKHSLAKIDDLLSKSALKLLQSEEAYRQEKEKCEKLKEMIFMKL